MKKRVNLDQWGVEGNKVTVRGGEGGSLVRKWPAVYLDTAPRGFARGVTPHPSPSSFLSPLSGPRSGKAGRVALLAAQRGGGQEVVARVHLGRRLGLLLPLPRWWHEGPSNETRKVTSGP